MHNIMIKLININYNLIMFCKDCQFTIPADVWYMALFCSEPVDYGYRDVQRRYIKGLLRAWLAIPQTHNTTTHSDPQ